MTERYKTLNIKYLAKSKSDYQKCLIEKSGTFIKKQSLFTKT